MQAARVRRRVRRHGGWRGRRHRCHGCRGCRRCRCRDCTSWSGAGGDRASGLARPQPENRHADRDQRDGPERAPADPEPEAPGHDRESERDEAEPEQLLGVHPSDRTAGRRGRDGQHDPRHDVGDDADSAEERGGDEPQAHQERLDAVVLRDTGGHAGDHAVVGAAGKPADRAAVAARSRRPRSSVRRGALHSSAVHPCP